MCVAMKLGMYSSYKTVEYEVQKRVACKVVCRLSSRAVTYGVVQQGGTSHRVP